MNRLTPEQAQWLCEEIDKHVPYFVRFEQCLYYGKELGEFIRNKCVDEADNSSCEELK